MPLNRRLWVLGGTLGLTVALAAAQCHDNHVGPPPPPPAPPVANAGGPYVSDEAGAVRFDGSASTGAAGDSLAFRWSFGDGDTALGARVAHVYRRDGVDTVRLVVTDVKYGLASAPATTTASHRITAVVFSGAGDIASCGTPNAEHTAELLDSLPGYVFTGGDNAFPAGRAQDYANCYAPTWGRHLARTFPVLGNHEYATGTAQPSFDYFGPRLGANGLGYYSTDIGAWHIVVLNDNDHFVPWGPGSAQLDWLRADLAAHPAPCTMALWHVPMFLSSNDTGYVVNANQRPIWQVLDSAGVDVVVNGHVHHYERMAPQHADGTRDDSLGIRQFNVGTGGESVALPTVAINPNSEVRIAAFGVLSFKLLSRSYAWRFLPVADAPAASADSGSGRCH